MKAKTENWPLHPNFQQGSKNGPYLPTRLKVPVNSLTIWNVCIALWSGCFNIHCPHFLYFPNHSPFSSLQSPRQLKASGVWINISYIIILNSLFLNESVSVRFKISWLRWNVCLCNLWHISASGFRGIFCYFYPPQYQAIPVQVKEDTGATVSVMIGATITRDL